MWCHKPAHTIRAKKPGGFVVATYYKRVSKPNVPVGDKVREVWTSYLDGKITRDAAVDELVERIISAPDRATQVAAARALDRVLLWGHYVIPTWHSRSYRLVYWDKLGRPSAPPANGLGFPATWWYDKGSAARWGFDNAKGRE